MRAEPDGPNDTEGEGGPQVSVVIPCYNQGRFLGEAIESVLAQSYRNFEVIVVDDGSTDDTSEVASRYEEVRLVRQENRGLSGARNRGLAEARGEYVVFLDSDDRLLPEAVKVGVRELEAHPECAFVSGHYRAIDADGKHLWTPHDPPVEEDSYLMLLQYCFGMPAVVTYRRGVFEEVGGFDSRVDAAADWDLYLRVARYFSGYHHGRVVAEYRQHGESMNENPALMLSSTVSVLRSHLEHVRGEKRYEKALVAGLRTMQADYGLSLAGRVRDDLRQRRWERAAKGLIALARYHPRGLAAVLSERRLNRSRLDRRLQITEQEIHTSERRLKTYKRQRRHLGEQPPTRKLRKIETSLRRERRDLRRLQRRHRHVERRLRELDWRVHSKVIARARGWKRTTRQLLAKVLAPVRPQPATSPTVALLPWGDVYEDYLDEIGVTLDEFCTDMTGGYLFGYVEALDQVGIRTVIVLWSRRVQQPQRRLHTPTGAVVWVLPASSAHLAARRVAAILGGRFTHPLQRAARLAVGYTATTPRRLAYVLREERCGALLVQEYEYPRFDVCSLLGRWLRLPVLATYQGGRPEKSRIVEGWVRRRTVPAAAGLLIGPRREAAAVSERYQLPSNAITLVHNPIDVQEWKPGDRESARTSLSLPNDVAVACWHGRVEIRRKGLDVLVEAWRIVCAERPGEDLRLLLCGAGAHNAQLRDLIASADLRGVSWRDEYTTDREIVRRQLAAADLFVFPSRHEGFAVAPMEAMACGRAVVACDAPGIPDLLSGGEEAGGIVVPRGDSRALAAALGSLLDDRARAARLGESARRRIVDRYSLEAIGSELGTALHGAAPSRFPNPTPSPYNLP